MNPTGSGPGPTIVVGLGITGRAVVDALLADDRELVVIDDRPSPEVRHFVDSRGLELIESPDPDEVARLVGGASRLIPAPGLPDRHPAIRTARRLGVAVQSEFDLAAERDDRPVVAVTGTDGKTTVTTMVAAMLEASGRATSLAGNNDTPLIAAIADQRPEVFVVEASSFRLGHSQRFAPVVATWLNFAPDHLDVHDSLDAYERAKASIFDHQPADGVAITNAGDPVVSRHRGRGAARHLTFSAGDGDYRVDSGWLVTDRGERIVAVDEMSRRAPHDIENALAAAATACSAGADLVAVAEVLGSFEGLAHRAQLIDEQGGVRFVDDSKATVPHAVIAAVRGCAHVVLIAGGRNKGLDLTALREVSDRVRAVVAIGEAASEVRAVFAPMGISVVDADSMDDAVGSASMLARVGDTVLLSPGCTSHDWYDNFAERGDDFGRAVRALHTGTGAS
ncbi:MAG: UDP-N-acetylmuramoyl-L-alanine--D-glutamate ligase [Acidimicrobiales bacterium]|nr:UDP-N-acetylmuramoyl-L-alanine--D-glutamate ligase [Acidimicrobiales bacterium]